MSEYYYDEKAKEFNNLRLVMLTMEEFVTKFMNLECYVPYLRDETTKVYMFISCLPLAYKEKMSLICVIPWMKQLENPSCATTCLNKDKNWTEVGNIKKMKSWTNVRKDLNPHLLGKGQEFILITITTGQVQPIEMG